jgi:BlaI family transcriptional regulator, penicillinase repressor
MNNKQKLLKPTESELNILNLLWSDGPCTVRDVHNKISKIQHTGYTTVLKTMQIMFEKGLVTRNEEAKAHIYSAACEQIDTQSHLLNDLVSRAFDGSKSQLIMRALGNKTSAKEIAELRAMLDSLESK